MSNQQSSISEEDDEDESLDLAPIKKFQVKPFPNIPTSAAEELEHEDFFEETKKHKGIDLQSAPQFKDLPKIKITPSSKRKAYNRTPHSSFVQLNELHLNGEEPEWKETARWIKYEEHVEEGGRWGRPHIATLSFHSMLNLRRCLETCIFLLDTEETDLSSLLYRVIEQMSVENKIEPEEQPALMRVMLLKHRPVFENCRGSFSFGRKKYNSYSSLQLQWLQSGNNNRIRESICSAQSGVAGGGLQLSAPSPKRRHSTMSYISNLADKNLTKPIFNNEINGNEFKIDFKDENNVSVSTEDLKKVQNDAIFKRIPPGAEATTVLIGYVDFLKQPMIAFVRLAEAISMPSITEVPIPVRFMFFLIGPKVHHLDHHEIGRSLGALMSNEQFLEIAYQTEHRSGLLSAINGFLDDTIVLPPGNWDRVDLLPFEALREKKDWIRSRKTKALKVNQSELSPEEKVKLTDVTDSEKKSPSPLEKTHRAWGGLRNDVARRFPMYKSDILDGLNVETLAATIFMYFANLSTAITFGGLLSEKTQNKIGISETLIAGSLVGLIFHVVGGQPLVIIGTTGPLLLFDEALYKFCLENSINFLTIRAYVGFWLILIGVAVAAFEGSVYVRLLTRFMQEIFSALITLIYIFETCMKLVNVYIKHPLLTHYPNDECANSDSLNDLHHNNNNYDYDAQLLRNDTTHNYVGNYSHEFHQNLQLTFTPEPNTALFCTILTLGTFSLAYYLKIFRNSHFLGRNARRALGDFGVPISITIFVIVDYFNPQVYTEKLNVPDGISPTDIDRKNWIVSLELDWISILIGGLAAFLIYILIFMETQISELIVDKPDRGLLKGSGLHLDIVVLCLLNALCGCFGFPWHCAATVRSVAHVSAVTIMSRTHAPGESPSIIGVREQRLSGFFVALLIGLSVNMAPLLRLIPMAVLFGVFLYMGVASMAGNQFFDRLRLFFMPVKHHPPTAYVQRVPTWKMHLFTVVQLLCLVILWAVKSSKISLAFPFFLIVIIPLRIKLASFFTSSEMNALDGSQNVNDEADFYEQATIPA